MRAPAAALVVLFGFIWLAGPAPGKPADNQKFETLAKEYVDKYLQLHPERATELGDHHYDDRLSDYSAAGRQAQIRNERHFLDALDQLQPVQLNRVNQVDYRILHSHIEGTLYQLETLRDYEWNPLTYNVGGSIYSLIARDFAPLPTRLKSVKARLAGIPAVIQAAKTNLRDATKIHTETAITQNKGTIQLIRVQLGAFLDQAPGSKQELAPAQSQAIAALESYGQWLERDLLPRATRDFRLGAEKFTRKLHYSLDSDLTPEQILAQAERDLKSTQHDMYETALPLYRQFFPERKDAVADQKAVIKAVLDHLAETHPTGATVVEQAKKDLAEATAFVRAKKIVTVPSAPLQVIEMPEFQRGVSVATCQPPGPLEPNSPSFFNISPPPANWKPEQVESYFREYNDAMLQDLTVHEAMPGHYLQLAHSNQFQAPTRIRTIFWSGTFVEGWGTIAEQVMAENGYGGAPVRMQQLKMRLRLIINAILDQRIHTKGMSETEALALMQNEGFQELGEAAGKWRRACLTSAQLSTYYVGNLELRQLRQDYERRFGKITDQQAFYDRMLSFGSPAPKYVRGLLGL